MEARFSAPVQTGPGAHPAYCKMGTGSLPGVKSGRGVTLNSHPLLVPWSRKSRAIPLLPLWAVRPVQSLSACTRVHFTFTLLKFTFQFTVSPQDINTQHMQLIQYCYPFHALEASSHLKANTLRVSYKHKPITGVMLINAVHRCNCTKRINTLWVKCCVSEC